MKEDPQDLKRHKCETSSSWWEYDARGIPLCRVCSVCKEAKLSRYRKDVLSNPDYWHDEPIEEDSWE